MIDFSSLSSSINQFVNLITWIDWFVLPVYLYGTKVVLTELLCWMFSALTGAHPAHNVVVSSELSVLRLSFWTPQTHNPETTADLKQFSGNGKITAKIIHSYFILSGDEEYSGIVYLISWLLMPWRWCWSRNIFGEWSQYQGCWCCGSRRYQIISSHDTDNVTWGCSFFIENKSKAYVSSNKLST